MNKGQFIDYLLNPQNLDAVAAAQLELLLNEFPYCQPARLLHLKALHSLKSIHYPSKLKLTAAYASDRKVLYKFVMQDELKNKISQAEKSTNEPLTKIYNNQESTIAPQATTTISTNTPVEETTGLDFVPNDKIIAPVSIEENPIEPIIENNLKEPSEETTTRPLERENEQTEAFSKENSYQENHVSETDGNAQEIGTSENLEIDAIEDPSGDKIEDIEIDARTENAIAAKPELTESVNFDQLKDENEHESIEIDDAYPDGRPNEVEIEVEVSEHNEVAEIQLTSSDNEVETTADTPPTGPTTTQENIESFQQPNLDEQIVTEEKDNVLDDLIELEKEILKEAIHVSLNYKTQTENNSQNAPIEGSEEKKQSEKKPEEANSKDLQAEKHSFTEWMKALKQKPTDGNDAKVAGSESKREPQTVVAKEEKQSDELNVFAKAEESRGIEKQKIKEQKGLIEKFIKEEPKIKPKKTEFFSPVNMAKMSLIEDFDFITETLAQIYAKQGNTAKAIRAYEKLILKYPKKSAYFATQIDELKDKS